MRPDALFAAILILLPPGRVVSLERAPAGLELREGRPGRLFPELLRLDPLRPALSLRSPRAPVEMADGAGWLDDVELESDLSFIRFTFTAEF